MTLYRVSSVTGVCKEVVSGGGRDCVSVGQRRNTVRSLVLTELQGIKVRLKITKGKRIHVA